MAGIKSKRGNVDEFRFGNGNSEEEEDELEHDDGEVYDDDAENNRSQDDSSPAMNNMSQRRVYGFGTGKGAGGKLLSLKNRPLSAPMHRKGGVPGASRAAAANAHRRTSSRRTMAPRPAGFR